MTILFLIAQIISSLATIIEWAPKIIELINLIRRLPKLEQRGALGELKLHVSAIKQAKKSGAVPVAVGGVFSTIGAFEAALKARLKDI